MMYQTICRFDFGNCANSGKLQKLPIQSMWQDVGKALWHSLLLQLYLSLHLQT